MSNNTSSKSLIIQIVPNESNIQCENDQQPIKNLDEIQIIENLQIQDILDDFLVVKPKIEKATQKKIEHEMFKNNKLITSREQNIMNSICKSNGDDRIIENQDNLQQQDQEIEKDNIDQKILQNKEFVLNNDDFFENENNLKSQIESSLNISMSIINFEQILNQKSQNKQKLARNQSYDLNNPLQATSNFNNSEKKSFENGQKNNDLQQQNEQLQIIEILQKQINRRTDDDVKILVEYFKKFDFSKREKLNKEKREKEAKDKFYQEISLKNKFQKKKESNKSSSITTPLDKQSSKKKYSVLLDQNEIACDEQSLEQSCRLMKFLMVPKYETIFEYDSFGDTFFMVLQGQAHCKIPAQSNLVQLSESEKNVYQQQFKSDLIKINVYHYANQLHNHIQETQKQKVLLENVTDYFGKMELLKIDNTLLEFQKKWALLNKEMPIIQNPYLHSTRQQLQEYIDHISNLYRKDIIRKQNNRKLQNNAKSQIFTQNLSQISLNETSIQSNSVENINDKNPQELKRKLMKQNTFLDDSSNEDFFNKNQEFQRFYYSCQQLLDKFEEQKDRHFYEIKLLKTVHVYKEFQSFGELALIQNKPRAAKLVVEGPNNAFFAVLSKKDYKLAQGKLQNEILQKKIKFLRKFIIFKNLSDSALSSLSYIMEEKKCSRDQIILKEDIDSSDYIYLVKKGEFKSFK